MSTISIYLNDEELDWVHKQSEDRTAATRSGVIRGALQLQRALTKNHGQELQDAVAFYRNHLVASDEVHREAMRAYNQALAEECDTLSGKDVEAALEATKGVSHE